MKIRPALDNDRQRVFEIRNEVIRTSDAILEDEPWDFSRWEEWWKKREKSLPFLVLVDGDGEAEKVMGYALLLYFMDRSGYRVTGEVSIHLDSSARGKGYGKLLFQELVEAGRHFGFYSLVARITGTNQTSIRLHESLGFTRVGHLQKIARKFGNFVDVLLYQKSLVDTVPVEAHPKT